MEEFVGRKEFDSLKEEVNAIKKDLAESQKLLVKIDGKIDIINEKILTSDKVDDLKLNPVKERISKLEDSQTWLRRTVIATIVGIIFKFIFDISKLF